ncbi:MAG: hypothetical protein NTY68_02725 [Candidatus Micrarchaeota archaeon]|nr:hypothetical protein [Candidatus Micrarchaeota archaeon]
MFYSKVGNSYKKIGPALDVAKEAHSSDIGVIHIIDRDLASGQSKNLDIYDSLTQFIHVQVELPRVCFVNELSAYNVRIAFVPPNVPLDINYKFSLLRTDYPRDMDKYPEFNDILTSNEDVVNEAIRRKKRIFFLGKNNKAFCSILDRM